MQSMINSLLNLVFNVYEAFTVSFFTIENDRLKCHSAVTFAQSFDKNRDIPIEGSLPGWVAKHNEPLVISNFDKDPAALGYYGSDEDIKSFMGYPMEGQGVVIVDSKKKYAFTDREKKILSIFASAIRDELGREKKSHEIDEKLEELALRKRLIGLLNIQEIAGNGVIEILDECMSCSGADLSFTGIEKGGKFIIRDLRGSEQGVTAGTVCLLGESIASLIYESGRELLLPYDSGYLKERPLFFPSEQLQARQVFGFPFLHDDTAFGACGFVSLSEGRPLKESTISLLRDASVLLSFFYRSRWMKDRIMESHDLEPLTNTLHFTKFLDILENKILQEDKFALMSIKFPGIDTYNRKFGIAFTNDLLVRISEIIKYCTENSAIISRKGGGHFYVLMTGNAVTEFENILKIIRHTINLSFSNHLNISDTKFVETGICYFPTDTKDLWELFYNAENTKTEKHRLMKEVGG